MDLIFIRHLVIILIRHYFNSKFNFKKVHLKTMKIKKVFRVSIVHIYMGKSSRTILLADTSHATRALSNYISPNSNNRAETLYHFYPQNLPSSVSLKK